MGCNSSLPLDHGDGRLPVKPHLRTTYGTAAAATGGGGFTSDNQAQVPESAKKDISAHDIVLLYSYTGVAWAGALQAELHKRHGLNVWCPVDANKAITRMSSLYDGGEIRPAGDSVRVPGGLDINVSQVANMVAHAPLGLLVLVTAGSTWDEGVLACLRHANCKDKPLLLLHAPESCPAPNVSDWPADVQQQLISRSTPRLTYISCYAQYGVANAVVNLQKQQKQRNGGSTRPTAKDNSHSSHLARAATTRIAASSQPLTSKPSVPQAPAVVPLHKALSMPVNPALQTQSKASAEASQKGAREALKAEPTPASPAVLLNYTQPWQQMLQRLEKLKQQPGEASTITAIPTPVSTDSGRGSRASCSMHGLSSDGTEAVVGHLPAHMRAGSMQPAVVLAVHHPAMLKGARATAQALAPHFHVVLVDGCRTPDRPARHTLHEFSISSRLDGTSSSSSSSSSSDGDAGLLLAVDLPKVPSSLALASGPEASPFSNSQLKTGVTNPTTSLLTPPLALEKADVSLCRPASPSAIHAEFPNQLNHNQNKGPTRSSQIDVLPGLAQDADGNTTASFRNHQIALQDMSGAASTVATSHGLHSKAALRPVSTAGISITPTAASAAISAATWSTNSGLATRRSASCALPNTALPASPAPAPAPSPTAVITASKQAAPKDFGWQHGGSGGPQNPHHITSMQAFGRISHSKHSHQHHHHHHHHHHHSYSHHSRSMSMGTLPWALNTQQSVQANGTAAAAGMWPAVGGVEASGSPPCAVIASGTEEAMVAVRGCSHYVLFTGYSLGTASPQAAGEVQEAMQVGATVHLVCEASFNLLHPDARRWSLSPTEAMKLTSAWLQRMLLYPDHVEPFLAELSERFISGTNNDSLQCYGAALLPSPLAAQPPASQLRPSATTMHHAGAPIGPNSAVIAVTAAAAHTTAPPVRTSATRKRSSLTEAGIRGRMSAAARAEMPVAAEWPVNNTAGHGQADEVDVADCSRVSAVSGVDGGDASAASEGDPFLMDRLGSSDTCRSSPMDASTGPASGTVSNLLSNSANTTAMTTAANTPGAPSVTAQLLHASHASSVSSGVVDLFLQVKHVSSGTENACNLQKA